MGRCEIEIRRVSVVQVKCQRGSAIEPQIARGRQETLYLGNLDARRDWGHVDDYVDGMWRILNHPSADDYVLATGEAHSVREFVERAFSEVGVEINWQGSGVRNRAGTPRPAQCA